MKTSRLARFSTHAAAALAALLLSAGLAVADFGKRQAGEGKYAEWTAEWWKWVYSMPTGENPAFDPTGEWAWNGQPYPERVFFLAGSFNSVAATRSVTIPAGTPLFGPLINFENDNIARPDDPLAVPGLRAEAAEIIDGAGRQFFVDGVERPDLIVRVKSPVFSYWLPEGEDNLYGGAVSGTVEPAVSDGYWFYVPPLVPGVHTLVLQGWYDPWGFSVEVTYEIAVE